MAISCFVNNLSGCSLSRTSTLSLVIWNPCSSDCHYSPFSIPACLCTPLFYADQTVILQMFMQTKSFLVSHFEDLGKHIVKLSRGKKRLFYKNRFYFTPTFGKCHFSQSSYRMVISTIPCALYSIHSEKGGKQIHLHFLCY